MTTMRKKTPFSLEKLPAVWIDTSLRSICSKRAWISRGVKADSYMELTKPKISHSLTIAKETFQLKELTIISLFQQNLSLDVEKETKKLPFLVPFPGWTLILVPQEKELQKKEEACLMWKQIKCRINQWRPVEQRMQLITTKLRFSDRSQPKVW